MHVGSAILGMLGGRSYAPNAVNYDGSTTYITATTLTGMADSSVGIYSGWHRMTGRDGATRNFLNFGGGALSLRFLTTDKLSAVFGNTAGTSICTFESTATFTADSLWHHWAIAWNVNFGVGSRIVQVYRDGVAVAGTFVTDTGSAFTVANSTGGTIFGIESANTTFFQGGVADTYVNIAATLDLSVPANLQKFRDSSGFPVDLGASGQLPTGSSPILFLKNVAASRGTNSGTGGNVTVTGTVTDITGP